MDKKTKEALEASIKKWQDIADGTGVDEGSINCPLCHIYNYKNCKGCPISERTKNRSCNKTPYNEWAKHISHAHPLYQGSNRVICETCKNIALEEVKFLESLKEKEFKPIEITFNFKNINEIKNMWLRLNIAEYGIEEFYKNQCQENVSLKNTNNSNMWLDIDNLAKANDIDTKSFSIPLFKERT